METTLQEVNNKESLHTFTVFPEDLNYTGTLFGGKILAEMDVAAIKPVRRVLYGSDCEGAVTVSLDKVDFINPAHLGDIIELKARIVKLGRTSIDVKVDVSKEDQSGNIATICEAKFTFVSVKNNKSHPHGRLMNHQN